MRMPISSAIPSIVPIVPLSGKDWLISSYGIEQYMECNRAKDPVKALEMVYQKTIKDLNQAFVDYVNLFKIDEAVEKRMGALIS